MAGMGRPPKADGQRRNRSALLAQQGTVRLPAAGRQGEPPAWPLGAAWKDDSDAPKREADIWRRLWATPQAVVWEPHGWYDVVARYARLLVVVENPSAPAALFAEVRQLEDRLGLSPMALLRLRWIVVSDEADEQGGELVEIDIRERLRQLG